MSNHPLAFRLGPAHTRSHLHLAPTQNGNFQPRSAQGRAGRRHWPGLRPQAGRGHHRCGPALYQAGKPFLRPFLKLWRRSSVQEVKPRCIERAGRRWYPYWRRRRCSVAPVGRCKGMYHPKLVARLSIDRVFFPPRHADTAFVATRAGCCDCCPAQCQAAIVAV